MSQNKDYLGQPKRAKISEKSAIGVLLEGKGSLVVDRDRFHELSWGKGFQRLTWKNE